MAAALADFNNCLNKTLNIASQAMRDASNEQGLDNLADIHESTDQDMKDICSNNRKPGGFMANPAAGDGAPALMPNQGANFGFLIEKRL